MNRKHKELVELANSLTIDELVTLLNIFSDRITSFHYKSGKCLESVEWVTTNGPFIQINYNDGEIE